MLVLLLALACSSHSEPTPDPKPAAAPVVEPAPAPAVAVEDDCLERCKHDNMARPVGADVIERDCAKACAAEHAVRSKADLQGKAGKNVTVIGTYVRTLHHGAPEPFMGTGLKLSDDAMLWISNGPDAAPGFDGRFDQQLTVTGRIDTGEQWDPDLWLRDAKVEGQTL